MPCSTRLRGERRDDVVGLVALDPEPRDPQRVEHLLDEADLAAEVARRLRPAGLVFRVGLVAEGLAGDVERDPDVGRLLVAQLVDEHRGEPVDRVGRDAHRGLEVLHGQREERPVGQRMAVQQQAVGVARSRPESRTALRQVRPSTDVAPTAHRSARTGQAGAGRSRCGAGGTAGPRGQRPGQARPAPARHRRVGSPIGSALASAGAARAPGRSAGSPAARSRAGRRTGWRPGWSARPPTTTESTPTSSA